MISNRWMRCAAGAVWLIGTGCTSLREIPPSDYASRPERNEVRVHTRDGLEYEFDYARVEGDTLVGFHRRDTEGAFEEFASLRLPLDDIDRLSSRTVDWYRTGLIGGGLLAAIVAAGLSASSRDSGTPSSSAGGKNPIP
jgi:hypothetical protein